MDFPTLGAGDFSSAVSGFRLRTKMCRPSANTENFRRAREKPLVPRVGLPLKFKDLFKTV